MGSHIPVLFGETIEALAIKPNGIYVDATLGRAGHSSAILSKLVSGHLYGFDLDETALEESKVKLSAISDSFTLIHSSFASIREELSKRGVTQVDGILADLGVSSPQFDDGSRGFSYRYDGPLDMRMDVTSSFSAYDVVNGYEGKRLYQVLTEYGEERDAKAIVSRILKAREIKPIETTFELVDIIKSAKSPKTLAKKGHPAKQTFQALRIEVNGEAKALDQLLADAPMLLKPDGRLAVITFMSLDDRRVKRRFHELTAMEGSRHGLSLRPEEIIAPSFHLLTHKPIAPSEQELMDNPRSASSKLRVLVKN